MTAWVGPPETWRPCLRHDDYAVSSWGRVRSPRKILKPTSNSRGYLKVNLGRAQQVYVHAIVAEAWHGLAPPGHVVDHLNWQRHDNRPTNLQWLPLALNSVRHTPDGWETPDAPAPHDWTPMADAELEELLDDLQAAGW